MTTPQDQPDTPEELAAAVAATIRQAVATLSHTPNLCANVADNPEAFADAIIAASKGLNLALGHLDKLMTHHRILTAQKAGVVHLAGLMYTTMGQAVADLTTQNILLRQSAYELRQPLPAGVV